MAAAWALALRRRLGPWHARVRAQQGPCVARSRLTTLVQVLSSAARRHSEPKYKLEYRKCLRSLETLAQAPTSLTACHILKGLVLCMLSLVLKSLTV